MFNPRYASLGLVALASLALSFLAPSAHAQGVTFVLDQPVATVTQGQSFTFTGSLINTTNQALQIKDISGIFDPTLSYDATNDAFVNLAANATYTGTIFTVITTHGAIGLNGPSTPTPPGTYTSYPTSFDFTDPSSNTVSSNTQQFVLHVSPAPVPEASTTVSFGLLLALGLGGAVVAARKKKAQA